MSSSTKSCNTAVLLFMQRANRPHDLKEVCSKIGGEFDSSAIQKSLDHLCTLNRVQMKTYSKVNIYCIVQDDEEPDLHPDEIRRFDVITKELGEKLLDCKKKLAVAEVELKTLKANPKKEVSLKDIRVQCKELDKVVAELQAQIDVTENRTLKISLEEQEKIIANHDLYTREYRKRKRMCNDMLDAIMEEYPDTKKKLIEEIGLETDEAYDFVPPK